MPGAVEGEDLTRFSAKPGAGSPRRAAAAPDAPVGSNVLVGLYREHWRELCRYLAATFGPGPPEPEDVAQLAFARVAAHRDFDAIENPKAFLWRTAYNIAVSEKRSQSVRRRRADEVKQTSLAAEGDDFTPERVLVAKEQIAAISAVLEAMPVKRRRMLVLNRIEGLSFAEIARRTGLSQTAVKKHVARAMIDLDAALAED